MFACDSAIQNMMFSPSNIEIYVFFFKWIFQLQTMGISDIHGMQLVDGLQMGYRWTDWLVMEIHITQASIQG